MKIFLAFSGNLKRIYLTLTIITILCSIGHQTSRFSKNSFAPSSFGAVEDQDFEEGSTRVKRQTRPCPLPPINCNSDPYLYTFRKIDGTCNNLFIGPYCGASHRPFGRWIERSPSGSAFRCPLSSCARPRDITVAMNKCPQHHSDGVTLTLMQWGQFIDHDLVLTQETEGVNGCCEDFRTVTTSSPDCVPIDVRGDEFYGSVGTTVNCLSFVRSKRATCVEGNNRETINELTPYLDASMIYGSTDTVANSLRSFSGGLLKTGPGIENLPCVQSTQDSCPRSFLPTRPGTSGNTEFFAGDVRVEEQPSLTSLHTVFLRLHNYIASLVNCNGDELKYQAARKIVGAIVQVITYNEFLPLVLGQNLMNDDFSYGRALSLDRSYFYNRSICTTAPNVFSTACFRFGHSLLSDKFQLPNGKIIKLAESFNNHDITINPNSFPSHFLGGIILQSAMPMDQHITEAVQSFLFAQGPSFDFGSDLPGRNVQRGRDHGIPGYVTWHNACVDSPYKKITSFDDLIGIMPDCVIAAFKRLYRTVYDIDLFPAGIAEYEVPGGLVGPTFACIIAEFFSDVKYGDRFWFQGGAFTSSQVASIRRTSLAAIICMFTNVQEIQPYVMLPHTGSSGSNPLTSCNIIIRNTIIPDLKTSIWSNICSGL